MKHNPLNPLNIWYDKCDECSKDVGEDELRCDENGVAYCHDCEPSVQDEQQ